MFSELLIRKTYFRLLFPDHLPLITIKDLFVEYEQPKDFPYTLNILMENQEANLRQIIKQGNFKPLTFKQFFPIFRESILGLTNLHIKCIAHRDIKPQNIIKINSNKYVLRDYDIGLNLCYQEQYNEDDFY